MKPIARISNSENGMVYFRTGISSCICSGGAGHDSTYPKIMEFYEVDDKKKAE